VDRKLRELEAEKSEVERRIVMLRSEEMAGAAKTDGIEWDDTERLKENIRAVVRRVTVHPEDRWFRVELFDGRFVRYAEEGEDVVIESNEAPPAGLGAGR